MQGAPRAGGSDQVGHSGPTGQRIGVLGNERDVPPKGPNYQSKKSCRISHRPLHLQFFAPRPNAIYYRRVDNLPLGQVKKKKRIPFHKQKRYRQMDRKVALDKSYLLRVNLNAC